jgi:O-antigen ligase
VAGTTSLRDGRPALAGLLLATIAALGWLEASLSAPLPVAFGVTLLLAFLALCLVSLEGAMLTILAVTPFSIEMVVPGSGSALQVPTEPMIFTILLVWALRFLARDSTRIAQPGFLAALLMALAACLVSLADSSGKVLGLKATANASWYALLGIFVMSNMGHRTHYRRLVAAWLVPGVLICLYSIVNVLLGNYERLAGFWWSWPFFTEHGTFSAYLSFVAALALALALELHGTPRFVFGAVGVLSAGQVILSLTRGAWLGLVVLALFFLAVSVRRILRPANLAMLGLGVVTVLGLIQMSGAEYGISRHSRTLTDPAYVSNLERINRWQAGWNMLRSDPLTGVGFGVYADEYRHFRRIPLSTEQSTHHMSVHNEYLKVAAETGLVGLLAAAVVFGFVVRFAWRSIRRARDPFERALAVGMTGGLVTYLTHAFVNNYLVYDKAAVPVWMAIGTLAAIDRNTTE